MRRVNCFKPQKNKTVEAIEKEKLEPDLLSHSLSLLQILSYLDIEDISSCQLVNRQWDALIRKYSNRLRNIELKIAFRLEDFRPQHRELLHISIGSRCESTVFMTEQQVSVSKKHHISYIFDYYEKHGTRMITKRQRLAQSILPNCTFMDWIGGSNKKYSYDYANDSLEDGLKTFLMMIINRYQLKKLTFESNKNYFPQQLSSMMIELFRKNSVKCNTVGYGVDVPGIEKLRRVLGCTTVEVHDWHQVRPLIETLNPPPIICRWAFYHYEPRLTTLQRIFDMIKQWSAGELRIKYVLVRRSSYPLRYVERVMETMDHIILERNEEKKCIEVVLRRVMDNVVLRFFLCNDKNILEIHDTAGYTGRSIELLPMFRQ